MQPTRGSTPNSHPSRGGGGAKPRADMSAKRGSWRSPTPRNPISLAGSSPSSARAPESPAASQPDLADILKRLQSMVAKDVEMQLKGGSLIRGRLDSIEAGTGESKLVLKDVIELPASSNPSLASTSGLPSIPQMTTPVASLLRVDLLQTDRASPANPSKMHTNGTGTRERDFQTDSVIGARRTIGQRDLTPWMPSASDSPNPTSSAQTNGRGSTNKDEETFGESTAPWDQFATNAKMFGGRTDYSEELYTTRLDRSGTNYRERELQAQKLADEILSAATKNPHLAEERNQVPETEADEEEKYSGVMRGTNAYVPPGARRSDLRQDELHRKTKDLLQQHPAAITKPIITPTEMMRSKSQALDVPPGLPKLSIEDHDKSAVRGDKDKGVTPTDVVGQLRNFAQSEREKLDRRKSSMAKSEKERKLADLISFGKTFKVSVPVPPDMVPLLNRPKDQRQDVKSPSTPRSPAIDGQTANPEPLNPDEMAKLVKATAKKKIPMHIQVIPPFGAGRPSKPEAIALPEGSDRPIPAPVAIEAAVVQQVKATSIPPPPPLAPAAAAVAAANKLNPTANAFVFKPNPKAMAFTPTPAAAQPKPPIPAAGTSAGPSREVPKPGEAVADLSGSVKALSVTSPQENNSFFGAAVPKKTVGTSVREDFNCLRTKPPTDGKSISPQWPFTGRATATMVPPPPARPFEVSPESMQAIPQWHPAAAAQYGAFRYQAGGLPAMSPQGLSPYPGQQVLMQPTNPGAHGMPGPPQFPPQYLPPGVNRPPPFYMPTNASSPPFAPLMATPPP